MKITIKFKPVKDGLNIFIKSREIEDLLKNDDIVNHIDFKMYSNKLELPYLTTNNKDLWNYSYDDRYPNLSFLRCCGLSHGVNFTIKALILQDDLNDYIEILKDVIDSYVQNIKKEVLEI